MASTKASSTSTSNQPHRVALYARVSTTNNQYPEMQLSELRNYAKLRGWHIAAEFTDKGVSGSKDSRPALNRLMADAHQRKIDGVLVWKLDRWGRSLPHLVNSIAELEAIGVAFVSLRDNLDLSTPSGRLMFQIIGAMAEFERSLIVERVRAGLRNARSKGKRLGRPTRSLDISKILVMQSNGSSLRGISSELDIPISTICRALQKHTASAKA
jgi:putative DNA-invertase from lambdoid prophage Rac